MTAIAASVIPVTVVVRVEIRLRGGSQKLGILRDRSGPTLTQV